MIFKLNDGSWIHVATQNLVEGAALMNSYLKGSNHAQPSHLAVNEWYKDHPDGAPGTDKMIHLP